ncbi:hypothetical protein ASPCAL09763 [Aspergillus calidoustus]|uniref:Uncharacterized protein n=1 Tax=Aspergillus calidoustus TaxID=454130 RepID=A0A0U5GAA4_ASPCI|nr:hypothetical protein ASPCAL09763 [Aspergillus calidoustus]
MTFDKQNNGSIAKPFTPTLSAAFNRANKSPLTPKLATPSTVRAPKRLAPSDHPASTPSRQTPEPSYLSANITPRSGPRTSRRDGPILSPGSTPLHSPQSSFSQPAQTPGPNPRLYRSDRSPVRMAGNLEPARTARAKTLTADLNTVSRPHSSTDAPAASPMFFHASDARSVSSSSDADVRSRVSVKSASPATFIYANGQEENQAPTDENAKRRSSGLSRPVATRPPTSSPQLKSPQLASTSPRLTESVSFHTVPPLDSPEIHSPINSPPLRTGLPRPIPVISHTKSSSLDTGRGTPLRETVTEGLRPSPILVSTLDSQVEDNPVTDPIPAFRPRIFSNGSTTSVDSIGSGLQSPVKSDHAGNSGPVLSARVERKILDLEISNSSLLAINKTLEREMRKQNAELRRFRRLSRSGRLSMAPSRSVSGTLSIPSEIDEGESEFSSIHSHDDMSDLSDGESMLDESSLGPDSVAEDDVQQKVRDEKRFLIDLAKHQELLADSQKMNQSLKRCLGWTEELIKEAKKALEYNVHVSDIQLGGRVLSPDELIDDGEAGRGLLATSVLASPQSEFPDIQPLDDEETSTL